MKILVTGSRNWQYLNPVNDLLDQILLEFLSDIAHGRREVTESFTVVHGACPNGADAMASAWVNDSCRPPFGVTVDEERWPAKWDIFGKVAGFVRNHLMVANAKPDICVAYIRDNSSGSTDCAGRAREAGVPIRVFRADKDGFYVGEDENTDETIPRPKRIRVQDAQVDERNG